MRILVVGAGALGGYFGARLIEAGRDVTFLVRAGRAEELRRSGLVVRSTHGNATLHDVPTVLADGIREPYDLVLLSCKAYNLDDAIESFAPAVGPSTMILPVLNGMSHIDTLKAKFGAANVLGGIAFIAATLNRNREIEHLNDSHSIAYGELAGGMSDRIREIERTFDGANFVSQAVDNVGQRMWDKWTFLATLAASTCVTRAAIGDILKTRDGKRLIEGIYGECLGIAQHNGFPVSDAVQTRDRGVLLKEGSPLTASMLRDIENRSKIEADHIVGNLIERGGEAQRAAAPLSLLRVAYTHLKAYEARETRGG
ncbi:2-dehydropantoate 2-reductase [Paraburkholderia sp. SARCC-3016]|uniref:2-dehydropantoate 2-reductase n=1 Tax=Paraburkholderia sp. SARCC-3016 TaxID=3058611 RepID=UPI0028093390|nr:2-dehydropantoate 2-reductase [Paraburkholderia sp. SARCC-3016]MDQ7978323.1 2-dehydropantoate 2-reductase [Paraburkholderia sp. SARCC-3016]